MIYIIYNIMCKLAVLSLFYVSMAFAFYVASPNKSVVERYALRTMQVCGIITAIILNVIVICFVITTDFINCGV